MKPTSLDAQASAKAVGLSYVSDTKPGITRKIISRKFAYFTADGKRIRNAEEIKRINALVIPPAYRDVWICTSPNGHLQATGRDARGRKQYRYHPRWREIRDATKYERMLAFGSALPLLRRKIDAHLKLPGMPREKILATVVRLLESTLIRVGNEEYAKENRSYGLTTLRSRHVDIQGDTIRFEFRGKSGKEHKVNISDPRLAKVIRRCMDLPGQELFQYVEEDGSHRSIDSADVNDYLRELTGSEFTAKDYRTWAGSILAMIELLKLPFSSEAQAKADIVLTIKAVARRLGNTAAICRKCYVHPALLDAYAQGQLTIAESKRQARLQAPEVALIDFLKRLKRASRRPKHR